MRKPFEGDFKQTQGFGENPDAYAKFGLKGHNGLDFALPLNTNLISPFAGKVIEVGWDVGGYGLYMKIENDKEGCILAHLTDNLLAAGADCSEGQLVAHSGNTGNSTGPHLHFGYYLLPRDRNNGYGGFIDPEPYLNPIFQELQIIKEQLEDYKAKYKEKCELETSLRGDIEKKDKQLEGLEALKKENETLQQKIKQLEAPVETVPTPPADAVVVTPPAPVSIDTQTAEVKEKVNRILAILEGLKKFFSMHLEW